MIYSLTGILIHIEENIAVIECAGVGYKCIVSMSTQRLLPSIGEKVRLYTLLSTAREGSIDLFGFITKDELSCFKKLTSVSGVGSKFGMSILSQMNPQEVALAVAARDITSFTRAPGIGKKIAERIILELSDKLKFDSEQINLGGANRALIGSKNIQEAINALGVLGYTASDAALVLAKFDNNLPVEELIRLSLKSLAKGL